MASLEAKLSLYLDALEQDADQMDKTALLEAIRRFKFFPAVAELATFFAGLREQRAPTKTRSRHAATGDGQSSGLVNNLAHLAVMQWEPPEGLGWRGRAAWEAWATGIARERVRGGQITGRYEVDGFHLDARPGRPAVPDDLLQAWAQLPLSNWERTR